MIGLHKIIEDNFNGLFISSFGVIKTHGIESNNIPIPASYITIRFDHELNNNIKIPLIIQGQPSSNLLLHIENNTLAIKILPSITSPIHIIKINIPKSIRILNGTSSFVIFSIFQKNNRALNCFCLMIGKIIGTIPQINSGMAIGIFSQISELKNPKNTKIGPIKIVIKIPRKNFSFVLSSSVNSSAIF